MALPDEPTRIAFCITDLDPGGAERALVQLVTRLDRARWQPQVICLAARGRLAADLEAAGVPVTCLGARRAWQVGILPRLLAQLRQFRPHILQTFLFHANLAGRFAGKIAGVPHIVSGIRVAEKRHRRHLWLDRWTNRLVDKNVCVSQAVARFAEYETGLKREKLCVIPNAVDTRRFAQAQPAELARFGIPPGSRTVVSVGRLDLQKDPLVLLDAIGPLLARFPDVHLLFVGDGPLAASLKQRIEADRQTARIHLAGWQEEVPEILKAANCLILCSRWEGMPNVVLEAMAAGLPVIATRIEGTEELIRPGETGLLVDPQNPKALQAALERLLSSPAAGSQLGHAAQQFVEKHFAIETMVAAYDALYRDLCGR